jgi:hypothetical protein
MIQVRGIILATQPTCVTPEKAGQALSVARLYSCEQIRQKAFEIVVTCIEAGGHNPAPL